MTVIDSVTNLKQYMNLIYHVLLILFLQHLTKLISLKKERQLLKQAELAKRTINLSTNSALNRLKWIRRNQDKPSNQNIKLNFSNNLISSISQLPISSLKNCCKKIRINQIKNTLLEEGSVSIGRIGIQVFHQQKL